MARSAGPIPFSPSLSLLVLLEFGLVILFGLRLVVVLFGLRLVVVRFGLRIVVFGFGLMVVVVF